MKLSSTVQNMSQHIFQNFEHFTHSVQTLPMCVKGFIMSLLLRPKAEYEAQFHQSHITEAYGTCLTSLLSF